jgi:hypothetical protein
MLYRWTILLAIIFGICQPTQADSTFTLEFHQNGMKVSINNRLIMEYVWPDINVTRPYFKQLKTLDGIQVTRNYPTDPVADKDNDDHSTYHPGVWMAFGDVSGHDYWRNKVKIRHGGLMHINPEGGFLTRKIFESKDGKDFFQEDCQYTISIEKHGYILHTQSTFLSKTNDFAFGDQEEMGFGVRLATGLRVSGGNGTMRNSEGGVNEKGTWGKKAGWLAGYGTVNSKGVGMMVIAHPDNFRKSWFHSRDYGLIVANPFGKKAMTGPNDDTVKNNSTRVKKGEEFELGFGLYVFSYDTNKEPDLAGMYQEYREYIKR